MKLEIDRSVEYNSGESDRDYRKLKLDVYPEEYIAATPDTLQLDLDTEEDLKYFNMLWHRFAEDLRKEGLFPWVSYDVIDSKTPGHKHIIVHMSISLDIMDRILLQSCFGSDRRRELRNWGRAKKGLKDPVLLRKK